MKEAVNSVVTGEVLQYFIGFTCTCSDFIFLLITLIWMFSFAHSDVIFLLINLNKRYKCESEFVHLFVTCYGLVINDSSWNYCIHDARGIEKEIGYLWSERKILWFWLNCVREWTVPTFYRYLILSSFPTEHSPPPDFHKTLHGTALINQ